MSSLEDLLLSIKFNNYNNMRGRDFRRGFGWRWKRTKEGGCIILIMCINKHVHVESLILMQALGSLVS